MHSDPSFSQNKLGTGHGRVSISYHKEESVLAHDLVKRPTQATNASANLMRKHRLLPKNIIPKVALWYVEKGKNKDSLHKNGMGIQECHLKEPC